MKKIFRFLKEKHQFILWLFVILIILFFALVVIDLAMNVPMDIPGTITGIVILVLLCYIIVYSIVNFIINRNNPKNNFVIGDETDYPPKRSSIRVFRLFIIFLSILFILSLFINLFNAPSKLTVGVSFLILFFIFGMILIKRNKNQKTTLPMSISWFFKAFVILNFVGLVFLNIAAGIYLYNTYVVQKREIDLCNFGIPNATQSVVNIEGEYGTGTGFWVTSDRILTNNHVVFENPRKVVINGEKYDAKVVAADTIRDLALLELMGSNNLKGEPLKFRDKSLDVAEDVYAIGYPLDMPDQTISKGIVSSITKDPYDDRVYIQTDTAINPGNSGGPLLDYCGKVVGINTSSLIRTQNISFAINYDQAKRVVGKLLDQEKTHQYSEADVRADTYPENPAEVVATYYNTLSYGIFDKAYDNYFSTRRKNELPRENWIKGISVTWAIRLKSSEKTMQENVVKVRFISTEYKDYRITDSEFEGTWTLVKEKGQWKMDESNIIKLNELPQQ